MSTQSRKLISRFYPLSINKSIIIGKLRKTGTPGDAGCVRVHVGVFHNLCVRE